MTLRQSKGHSSLSGEFVNTQKWTATQKRSTDPPPDAEKGSAEGGDFVSEEREAIPSQTPDRQHHDEEREVSEYSPPRGDNSRVNDPSEPIREALSEELLEIISDTEDMEAGVGKGTQPEKKDVTSSQASKKKADVPQRRAFIAASCVVPTTASRKNRPSSKSKDMEDPVKILNPVVKQQQGVINNDQASSSNIDAMTRLRSEPSIFLARFRSVSAAVPSIAITTKLLPVRGGSSPGGNRYGAEQKTTNVSFLEKSIVLGEHKDMDEYENAREELPLMMPVSIVPHESNEEIEVMSMANETGKDPSLMF